VTARSVITITAVMEFDAEPASLVTCA